jgi:hypothetical protein
MHVLHTADHLVAVQLAVVAGRPKIQVAVVAVAALDGKIVLQLFLAIHILLVSAPAAQVDREQAAKLVVVAQLEFYGRASRELSQVLTYVQGIAEDNIG